MYIEVSHKSVRFTTQDDLNLPLRDVIFDQKHLKKISFFPERSSNFPLFRKDALKSLFFNFFSKIPKSSMLYFYKNFILNKNMVLINFNCIF